MANGQSTGTTDLVAVNYHLGHEINTIDRQDGEQKLSLWRADFVVFFPAIEIDREYRSYGAQRSHPRSGI